MSSTDTTSTSRRSAARTRKERGLKWPGWLERWPRGARWAFVSVCGIVALVIVAAGVDGVVSAGKVHPGVRVGDLPVGGMTELEAAEAIAARVEQAAAEPVEVVVGEQSWSLTAADVGLSVDATSLAEQAYAVGRGDAGAVFIERLRALSVGFTVPLDLLYDVQSMDAMVRAIGDQTGVPAVDASVKVDGAEVSLIEPRDGTGIPEDVLIKGLLEAFVSDNRTVTLSLVTLHPDIDADAARQAYNDALNMVSAPVTLYFEQKEWEVAPETIGEWIGFRSTAATGSAVLEAYIAAQDVSATVLPMVAEVGKPAKNAGFKTSSGKVTIVPAEDGLAADAADLATRLEGILTGDGERRAELTMHRVEPEITTEEAQQMGIVERLSTFTTDYSSSNKPRVNNIHLLADALDGTLIPPGGTFEFNETIGPRTAAKGYQEANAIVNGKLVPQLGGGICQVGTTIFNTVFFSGLPVIERHNHSQYISHYPKGRDATVSWGGPNFKFKNDTDNWVLIATSHTNSSVTISLYGTNPGYKVTYKTGDWTNVVDPPIREIKDPTLPEGSKVIEERGVSGRTIVVTRTVTKNGAVIRTDTFKSVYRPVEEVVRVGTKKSSSTPTTVTP